MIESKTTIDMKKIGMRLKTLMQQNGFTVRDIQEYLCLACPQAVYKWYKGAGLPSVDNLLRLSELFHVHMDELLVKEHRPLIEWFEYEHVQKDHSPVKVLVEVYDQESHHAVWLRRKEAYERYLLLYSQLGRR